MVTLTISAASKPPPFARGLPVTVEVNNDATIADVKASIAAKFPKFYTSRQKLSLKTDRKALVDERKLGDIFGGKFQDGELQVKDLGPQINWKTVFMVEYAGPLVIHPLIYHFPKLWYGTEVQHSTLQKYVYACVLLHFAKRELETLFVHRFSNATMPLLNIFKNSAHYHIFSGIALAYDVYRPKFSANSPYITETFRNNETYLWISAALWGFAQLSNLHTHLTLRSLRPTNTRTRAVPYGYGFTYMSCPNYFFETMAWTVISVMTGSVAAWVFTIIAFVQMALWAVKKHKNYKKEFGKSYPRGRKAIIPFIL